MGELLTAVAATRSPARARVSADVRSHCPYCAFQCGMSLVDDPEGGIVRVEPDAAFPVNNGQLCIKGHSAAELLDEPRRLLHPMVRGSGGELRRASWEAALDELAARLERTRARHGAEAVGVFGSGALTNEKAYLLGKFARVALRTPNIDYNGRYCMSSAAAGQNRAFGIDRGLPFPVSDIAEADAILLWGSNCADTMPPIMQWFRRQRERGGTLIVVDPRRSTTAREAQVHLQPVPGSDLALANGLLLAAILDGLVDEAYLAERTVGWEEVRRSLLSSYPARIERITGISERQMRSTARTLAEAPAAMLLSGRGPEQQSKGSDTVLAFTNLMLALGKVGGRASGYGCLTGQGNGQGGREHGQKADQLPGYRLIADPEHRAAVARVWGVEPESLPGPGLSAYEMLSALGRPGGVRALLVAGSNVAVASPNVRRVIEGLGRLDCLAVMDALPNDTQRCADILLPVTQWAEEEGTMTNLEGRVIRRRRMVDPPPGVRTDLEVLVALAERLGEGERFPSAEPEAVFEELRRASAGGRADYSGISYARIDAEQGVFWPCPEGERGTPRLFAERFAHPDGRARLVPVAHRAAGEEPDDAYPYWFTTGRYREHYNSGAQTRLVERLREARDEPLVELHPILAARLGLGAEGRLLVESRRGSVAFRAAISPDIRPDTLFAPFHWGGARAANILTSAALDPVSRMPEFKLCAVRVTALDGPRRPAYPRAA